MKLVGCYYVLTVLPVWATVAIFAALMLVIVAGRDILEGLPYQVSYSALVGDAALVCGVLIGATILQRGMAFRGMWPETGWAHINLFLVCVGLGSFASLLTLRSRSGQAMDIVHDVAIAPLFAYLAVTLVPVIYYNGTRVEKTAVLFFVLVWLALVGFDIKHDRMNQRRWLQNHGVYWGRAEEMR